MNIVMVLYAVEILTLVFNRVNAQTQCLNDFVSLNNLAVSWDHENSVRDLTYVNTDLSHFSCIDHFIVSKKYVFIVLLITLLYMIYVIHLIITYYC